MCHNKKKKNIRKLAATTKKAENSPRQQQKWMRQQKEEEEEEDRLQLQAATGTDILNISRNRKPITATRRRRSYSIAIIARNSYWHGNSQQGEKQKSNRKNYATATTNKWEEFPQALASTRHPTLVSARIHCVPGIGLVLTTRKSPPPL